jgi:hypothetical protein
VIFGRCLRLGGAAATGRSQGRGRAGLGRLLRATRPCGADRLPGDRCAAFAVTDALAPARAPQPGRPSGRRHHTAGRRHRCCAGAGTGSASARSDSAHRADDRWPRQHRPRRSRGAERCRSRCPRRGPRSPRGRGAGHLP